MNVQAFSAASVAATFFTLILGLCAIGAGASSLAVAPTISPAVTPDRTAAMAGGESASHGLPSSYFIPASVTPVEAAVITYAIGQLDKPYLFGAAGPDAFDCSGLTMAAWAQAGFRLPHSTLVQARSGIARTPRSMGPGDLVLVPGDDGSLASPEHVGLYLGSGLVINAADEELGIRVQALDNFVQVGHGLSAIRHIA